MSEPRGANREKGDAHNKSDVRPLFLGQAVSGCQGILQDETDVSEITIQPDGRIYVFGASRQVLELLETLNPVDRKLQRVLEVTRRGKPCVCPAGKG
jgi:hypothetical protein